MSKAFLCRPLRFLPSGDIFEKFGMTTKRNPEFRNDDLESEFDYESEAERKRARRADFLTKEHPGEIAPGKRSEARSLFNDEHGKWERKKRQWRSLDVYSRHKEMINQYYLYYPGATNRLQRDTSRDKTDLDVIRQNHQFIWTATDEIDNWERKLAKRYYDKLFKEYCIVDLSRYKENKFAMRWRVEKEVVDGKGHFLCGNKHCRESTELTSWEVNFAYLENDQKKNALVKIRLCPRCSDKLNFHRKRNKAKRKRRSRKRSSSVEEIGASTSTHDDAQSVTGEETQEEKDKTEKRVKMTEAEAKELWSKPVEMDEEKSREDEFEDFLDDMLL